jgi:Raf kinase inhibitor-like YbhB/YbcL family protein
MRLIPVTLLLAACGGGDSNPAADAAIDGKLVDAAIDTPAGGTFTLSSPMLAPNATIATANTCNGANTSPQLVFASPPTGTMGYAVVLTDKSFNDLVHWVIYDIPGSATGLPANVDKVYAPTAVPGAHQTQSYQATARGYLGPCPPALHTYEFAVHALDVATLPGATMATDRAGAIAIINQHRLGMATLVGTYAP